MAEGKEIEKKQSGEVKAIEEWPNPLVPMSHAQEQVAILLEIAYLALKDHPTVAKEVRLSANAARTQHMMTLGLMKTYVITSSNILNMMIPLMKTAVQLKTSVILRPMFLQILEFSVEMRNEAITTRQKYYELQHKIQDDTAKVNDANAEVEGKQKKIQKKRKHEEDRKKHAEKKLKDLENQRKEKDAAMKKNREMFDATLKISVSDDGGEMCKTFMENIMTPKFPEPSASTTALKGVFGAVSLVINTVRQHYKGKRALQASEHAQKLLNLTSEERMKIESQMDSKDREAVEAGYQMDMLDLEHSSLGDLESLVEATNQLAKIDGELVNIIFFWDNLAAFLTDLTQKGKMGECFLVAIENENCAKMFNDALEKVEKGWSHFGGICSTYVKTAEQRIPIVYGFLSQPIDNLSIEERKKRSTELVELMRTNMEIAASANVPKLKDAE